MIRILLQYAIPLLAPFVLYAAYIHFGRRRQPGEKTFLALDRAPWIALFAAGAVLVGLTTGVLAWLGGEDPAKEYVPPRLIDGKIVPGHFE